MVNPEANFLKHALFICYFPQISQGPIGKYENLGPQLFAPHGFEGLEVRRGVERFLIGLFKKLVVANNLGLFVDSVYNTVPNRSGIVLALATVLYAFQLYADFSGYMDMACGVSQCLGIQLAENFETPYFSGSISEFWRRWHITLGAWFRDYLYYPILRSSTFSKLGKVLRKKGKKKLAQKLPVSLALFVTWFLIGLWHGADYTFICYGLYHGMFIILDTLLSDFYEKTRQGLSVDTASWFWTSFRILRTFCITCFGYILFRADGMSTAWLVLERIFRFFYYEGWSTGFYSEQFDIFYWCCIAILLLALFGMELIERKESVMFWLDRQKLPIRWGILYFLIGSVLCVVLFSDVHEASAGNFLYFNF
ncbi:MAG: MBOAT family protein [Oscillospiraceae bacterium]|nr:MBOAT family protein [Oscillospiraceae bacterium]